MWPFVAASIPVYLSLNLLFLLVPFVFRRWFETMPLLLTMAAETLVACVCFACIPLQTSFATAHPEGLWGIIFEALDRPNLGEFNHFQPAQIFDGFLDQGRLSFDVQHVSFNGCQDRLQPIAL